MLEHLARSDILRHHKNMKNDDVQSQNRRGRPATGTNLAIGVRMPPDLLKALDEWCARQRPIPTRPEGVRQLVEAALREKSND